MQIREIILWDLSADRLHEMEANLKKAMRQLGISAIVQLNSEEPLLSRHHLLGHTPAVQVNGGQMWRLTPGVIISEENFRGLLTMLMKEKNSC